MASSHIKDDMLDIIDINEEDINPNKLELEIERTRILHVLDTMVRNMEVGVCLPMLLEREYILEEYLPMEDIKFIFSACERYANNNREKSKIFRNQVNSPLSTADPKLDPKLSQAIKILIDCKPLRCEVDDLLDNASQTSKIFLNDLRELVAIAKERFAVSAPEEMERERQLRLSWKNNEECKAMILEISKKLNEQTDKLKECLEARQEIISQHKIAIESINKKCREDIRRRIQDSERDMVTDSKSSEERQEILSEDARNAQAKYNALLELHLKREKELRVKKDKVESQLISWLNKYDSDVGDRQKELDAMNDEYEMKSREYEDLRELYKAQDKEYNVLMAERDDIESEESEAKLFVFLSSRAQRRITRAWKAYKQRKIDRKKAKAEARRLAKIERAAAKALKKEMAAQKRAEAAARKAAALEAKNNPPPSVEEPEDQEEEVHDVAKVEPRVSEGGDDDFTLTNITTDEA